MARMRGTRKQPITCGLPTRRPKDGGRERQFYLDSDLLSQDQLDKSRLQIVLGGKFETRVEAGMTWSTQGRGVEQPQLSGRKAGLLSRCRRIR
jgi:hypothetical protein